MKMNLLNKLPFVLCLIFGIGILLSSCGDDNIDPDAQADKDNFIGSYIGEVTCGGILATVITDPAIDFEITETDPATDDQVQLKLPSLVIPLDLTGTVSGTNVDIPERTVEDQPVEYLGQTVILDVTASGNGSLVGNALTATIFLAASGDISGNDECTIMATKQ